VTILALFYFINLPI